MRLSIPEILKQVNDAGADQRAALLLKYNCPLLRQLLQMNFDHNVVIDLPAGTPPFKTNRDLPWNMGDSNLYAESRRLYLMVKGHPRRPPGLKRIQVENIWIQILEGVHCTEADLLNAIKDRELETLYPNITDALVRSVWPELITSEPPVVKRGPGRPRKNA